MLWRNCFAAIRVIYTYSYRYLLTLDESLDETEFWFEDEYNNRTSVKVEELLRVKYNDFI